MYAVFDHSRNSHDKKGFTSQSREDCENFIKMHNEKDVSLTIDEYSYLDYQTTMRENFYSES